MWVGVPGVTSYRAYKYFKRGSRKRYNSKPIMSEQQATAYAILMLTAWYGGLAIASICLLLALPSAMKISSDYNASKAADCNRSPWSESEECQ